MMPATAGARLASQDDFAAVDAKIICAMAKLLFSLRRACSKTQSTEDCMDADILDPLAFAATDREAWLRLVGKALKGADFEQTLVSTTDDGIAIEPLYARRAEAEPILRREPLAPWTVTQRVDDPDIGRALTQAADDVGNGATGVSLVFHDSPSAFGTGQQADARDVYSHLAGVVTTKSFSLRIEAAAVTALHLSSAIDTTGGKVVHFGLDPLSSAAFSGARPNLAGLSEHFRRLQGAAASGTIFNADGRPVHNAGGTEAQELAVMAASVAEYLRVLEIGAIAPEAVLGAISLCLCADQDQFVTISKARAARLIFARIVEACGCDPSIAPHLFMETSHRMLTRLDPETNILRNTIAVFSAGICGADEISVLPHTLVHGIPDPLARLLARNTQVVLMTESHLDHVNDPAAGAGGIEALTEELAEKAWGIFGDIERGGGLAAAIGDGRLREMVAHSRTNRPDRLIVGTTMYPAKMERPVAVVGPLAVADAAGLRTVRLDEEKIGNG
jgi:methylmalonyl-CoA mutase